MTVRVAIRPDHGPGVGGGHLGRCLALAEAFVAEGCEVALAAGPVPDGWATRYEAAGVARSDPAALRGADVAVLDGYRFGPEEQRAAAPGATVLVVDDHGITEIGRADAVLDQNLGAEPAPGWPAGALALTGTSFALVRREVRAARLEGADRPAAGAPIVVSAGGAPPAAWLALLHAGVEASGWTGPVHELRGLPEVGPVLAGARLGVLAAGSTVWDALCVGLPCVVVAFVDNQEASARRLGAAGLAEDGGDLAGASARSLGAAVAALAGDGDRRAAMAARGRAAVDGLGAPRVARAVLALHGGAGHEEARRVATALQEG